MANLGGLAGAIYNVGQTMRQDHLMDLQNRKQMQDHALETLTNWATNPGLEPAAQQEAQQLLLETQQTPLPKFKSDKISKAMGEIISNSMARQMQSRQPNPGAGQMQQGAAPQGGAPQPQQQAPQALQAPPMPAPPLPVDPSLAASQGPEMAAMAAAAAQNGGMPPNATAPSPLQAPPMPPRFNDPMRAAQTQAAVAGITGQPAIAAKIAEQNALQQAETARQLAIERFKRENRMKAIEELKKGGANHFIESIGSNGEPAIKPDAGHMVAGIVPGTELEGEIDPKTGKPLETGKFYRIREYSDGQKEYFPQTSVREMRQITDPTTGVSYLAGFDREGHEVPGTRTLTLNTAMIPQTSTSTNAGVRMVQQPDGSTVAVPVTTSTSTTRQRALPGAPQAAPMPAAPVTPYTGPGLTPTRPTASVGGGGRVVGGRSLTPDQKINLENRLGAFDNTISLVQNVQSNMGVLNSLLAAKKIDLQIDPRQGILTAIINRSVPLTDQEAALAGDFASLLEHINTLRGPLGATGFRGPEAFSALQQQRGNLLANPAVTKRVLENTMKALQTQRGNIAKGLEKAGEGPFTSPLAPPNPPSAPANPYR